MPSGNVHEIGFKSNKAAGRNGSLDKHAVRMMMHVDDVGFTSSEHLKNIAEIFRGYVHIQSFNRLEQTAIVCPFKDNLWSGNKKFKTFAAHLLYKNGNLHFSTGLNFKVAGDFG